MIIQYKSKPDAEYWYNAQPKERLKEMAKLNMRIKPAFNIVEKLLNYDDNIIEAGAGNGWWIIAMRNIGYEWSGIDFSKKLKQNFTKQLPRYSKYYKVCDIRNTPFKDNTFDVYFSPGVIEHYENKPLDIFNILTEAKRIVKKNGTILIMVPIMNLPRYLTLSLKETKFSKDKKEDFYQVIYSRSELKDRLKESGLTVHKFHGLGVHDFQLFKRKVFPKYLHNNKQLNYYFNHMVLAECKNDNI